jgi:RNA polymerase sigma factor (sigma-70 family)
MSAQPRLPAHRTPGRENAVAGFARDAAAGDPRAWTELVDRFDGLLRGVAGNYRLQAADVDDVVQTTWLRALDRLETLQVHEAVGSWLMVIARREAMRVAQRPVREILTDSTPEPCEADGARPDVVVVRQELTDVIHRAVDRLSGRQQRLIATMLRSPTSSYEQLSSQLGMPVGAIGPTRSRALVKLRRDRALQCLASGAGGRLAA